MAPLAQTQAPRESAGQPMSTKGRVDGTTPLSRQGLAPVTSTLRDPPWAYLHLELYSANPNTATTPPLDLITAASYLGSALSQYLGLTGAGIYFDILKLDGHQVWVRVARQDLSAVLAAVGGWAGKGDASDATGAAIAVGWRVRGKGNWLMGLISGQREENLWQSVAS